MDENIKEKKLNKEEANEDATIKQLRELEKKALQQTRSGREKRRGAGRPNTVFLMRLQNSKHLMAIKRQRNRETNEVL